MSGVRDHRDLDAWKLADEVRRRVYAISARPAISRRTWLCDQLQRAASAGCVNTAEGFSRYWPRDFARFLDIARASMTEVIEHIGDARAMHLVTEAEADEVTSYARRARGAMIALARYLRSVGTPMPLQIPPGQTGPSKNRRKP